MIIRIMVIADSVAACFRVCIFVPLFFSPGFGMP